MKTHGILIYCALISVYCGYLSYQNYQLQNELKKFEKLASHFLSFGIEWRNVAQQLKNNPGTPPDLSKIAVVNDSLQVFLRENNLKDK